MATYTKSFPYTKSWNKSTTAYQLFQKCADGLREIHPDLNGFNIDLEDLYYTSAHSDDIVAQFASNQAYKLGVFALGDYLNSYEDLLATMIHEFAHCLNFIESAYITNKKSKKELGHGKAFREACRRLAKIICTEEEYKMCMITAFDGPLHIKLTDKVYRCGRSLYICEEEINQGFGGFRKICTIRDLLRDGIVDYAKKYFGIDLVRGLIEHINIQQNTGLDDVAKNAEEFYNYSDNLKELGFFNMLIK